jgi:hypothetical protein
MDGVQRQLVESGPKACFNWRQAYLTYILLSILEQ